MFQGAFGACAAAGPCFVINYIDVVKSRIRHCVSVLFLILNSRIVLNKASIVRYSVGDFHDRISRRFARCIVSRNAMSHFTSPDILFSVDIY